MLGRVAIFNPNIHTDIYRFSHLFMCIGANYVLTLQMQSLQKHLLLMIADCLYSGCFTDQVTITYNVPKLR